VLQQRYLAFESSGSFMMAGQAVISQQKSWQTTMLPIPNLAK
jgi:hypothetical protein